MPPAAKRTIEVFGAPAVTRPSASGSSSHDDDRGRGSTEVESATTNDGKDVKTHHKRDWTFERNAKVQHAEKRRDDLVSQNPQRQAKQQQQKDTQPPPSRVSTIGIYTLIGEAPAETLDGKKIRRGVVSKFSSTDVPTASGFTTRISGAADSVTTTAISTDGSPTTVTATSFAHGTASANHASRRAGTGLPAIPVWAQILGASIIGALMLLAVVLYLVNFPPKCLRRSKTRSHEKRKYHTLNRRTVSDSHIPTQDVHSAGFSTSAETPNLETPTLHARRRNVKSDSAGFKKASNVVGLGIGIASDHEYIELEDMTCGRPTTIERHRSFDDIRHGATVSETPRNSIAPSTAPLMQNFDSIASSSEEDSSSYDPYNYNRLRPRHSDIEDGLLRIPAHHSYDNAYASPRSPRPYSTPDSESPTSSRSVSPHGLLKSVGNGIEFLADKAVRLMHDHVGADSEEGLLLPVRDGDREVKDKMY